MHIPREGFQTSAVLIVSRQENNESDWRCGEIAKFCKMYMDMRIRCFKFEKL